MACRRAQPLNNMYNFVTRLCYLKYMCLYIVARKRNLSNQTIYFLLFIKTLFSILKRQKKYVKKFIFSEGVRQFFNFNITPSFFCFQNVYTYRKYWSNSVLQQILLDFNFLVWQSLASNNFLFRQDLKKFYPNSKIFDIDIWLIFWEENDSKT